MKYIRVPVDPILKKRQIDLDTYKFQFEHMNWCKNNCKSEWYNDTEDYSSIVFIDPKEALKFALVWSNFTEEQKVIAILRWAS